MVGQNECRTLTDPPASISLADGWSVDEFELGKFGFADVEGVDASLVSPDGSLRLSAYPVNFERQGGVETFSGVSLEQQGTAHRRDVTGDQMPQVAPVTAFALGAYYEEDGENNHSTFTILGNGYDPFALACWLSHAVTDGGDYRELQMEARGPDGPTIEGLTSTGLNSGVEIHLPLRYAAYIGQWPRYDCGVPVIPPTASYLAATVTEDVATKYGYEEGSVVDAPVQCSLPESVVIEGPPEFVTELEISDVRVDSLAKAPQSLL